MCKWFLGGACALVLAALTADSAYGQCAAGSGGGSISASGGTTGSAGGTAVASGRLLTSPGSWAYSMMVQTRMRQAALQQQSAFAAQQAAERADLKAKRQANWQQRRSSELIQRQQRRELALATANR